jgi:hypothetical protein
LAIKDSTIHKPLDLISFPRKLFIAAIIDKTYSKLIWFSRQIYLYGFHIPNSTNLKVIYDLYSQCSTQALSKRLELPVRTEEKVTPTDVHIWLKEYLKYDTRPTNHQYPSRSRLINLYIINKRIRYERSFQRP